MMTYTNNNGRFVLSLFLFFIISSCTVGQRIGSLYKSDGHSFVFNSDSTFTYEYRNGWHNYEKSMGNYTIVGNTIVLNSQYKEVNGNLLIPATFFEKKTSQDSLLFDIQNNLIEDPSYKYIIILDGVEQDTFRSKEIGLVNDLDYSSVQIKLHEDSSSTTSPRLLRYEVISDTYSIETPSTNYFKVLWDIDGGFNYYIVFDQEELEIKRRKLYWKNRDKMLSKKFN